MIQENDTCIYLNSESNKFEIGVVKEVCICIHKILINRHL